MDRLNFQILIESEKNVKLFMDKINLGQTTAVLDFLRFSTNRLCIGYLGSAK